QSRRDRGEHDVSKHWRSWRPGVHSSPSASTMRHGDHTLSGSISEFPDSAAADKRDNLHFIPLLERMIVPVAFEQPAVDLNRDLVGCQLAVGDEGADGGSIGDDAFIPIDDDFHARILTDFTIISGTAAFLKRDRDKGCGGVAVASVSCTKMLRPQRTRRAQ